jgi:hypothetical protein
VISQVCVWKQPGDAALNLLQRPVAESQRIVPSMMPSGNIPAARRHFL